jgi:hypothetical protein
MKKVSIIILILTMLLASISAYAVTDQPFGFSLSCTSGSSSATSNSEKKSANPSPNRAGVKITNRNFYGTERMDFVVVTTNGVKATAATAKYGNTITIGTSFSLNYLTNHGTVGTLYELKATIYPTVPASSPLKASGTWTP